jgi:hypothetical protein
MSTLRRFQILLEDRQLAALRAIEAKNGASIAGQVRIAVEQYLKRQTVVSEREINRQWRLTST